MQIPSHTIIIHEYQISARKKKINQSTATCTVNGVRDRDSWNDFHVAPATFIAHTAEIPNTMYAGIIEARYHREAFKNVWKYIILKSDKCHRKNISSDNLRDRKQACERHKPRPEASKSSYPKRRRTAHPMLCGVGWNTELWWLMLGKTNLNRPAGQLFPDLSSLPVHWLAKRIHLSLRIPTLKLKNLTKKQFCFAVNFDGARWKLSYHKPRCSCWSLLQCLNRWASWARRQLCGVASRWRSGTILEI